MVRTQHFPANFSGLCEQLFRFAQFPHLLVYQSQDFTWTWPRPDLDVATTRNNIGEVYRHQGKFDEALQEYQKSLDVKIKVVGHDHRWSWPTTLIMISSDFVHISSAP